MANSLPIPVSKRPRALMLATLCLLMAQMMVSLSGCHEEPLPMGAYSVSH
jgi:hypothetical protein